MNIEKIEQILKDQKQPKFRLGQIKKAVYQDGISSFGEISTIPKELRSVLEKEKILSFEVEKVLISKDVNSAKALVKLSDGNKIETVLISPKENIWSVCISSQVGCPMNCAFCATGQTGFKRNLTAEEIVDQVLFWKQYLKTDSARSLSCREYATSSPKGRGGILNNVVYMGMGEPFLNWKEVLQSLKILSDPKGMAFGSRSISISTVGIPSGIEKLTEDFPQVNLAVSLHFSQDEKRAEFMPANKNLSLEKLKIELEKYFQKSNRKVFLEYILFSRLNDSEKDAKNLLGYIKSFEKPQLLHVNLIRYNSTDSKDKFISSSAEQAVKFRNYLLENKINCTIRRSLGADIEGACGQLAGKK
ncbi:MAG: 23S rRNA (adenine(2503)-C(2))-methyltransferase RlmN [Parcubacteria group bacterium]|jgi:23S rRNA (adenine2503-C2)-methyltransferase